MKPKVHTQWAHAIDAVSSPNHVLTVLNNQKSSKEKKNKSSFFVLVYMLLEFFGKNSFFLLLNKIKMKICLFTH